MFTLVVVLVNLLLLGAVFGVYFTYSNSVVPALDRVEPAQAVAAMRAMNVVIVNPRFMLTFAGPPLTALAGGCLLQGDGANTSAYLHFGAAALYFAGCFAVTGGVNVPLNNALRDNPSTNWDVVWAAFSPRWRRFNTVRTFSSGLALLLCGLGLVVWDRSL